MCDCGRDRQTDRETDAWKVILTQQDEDGEGRLDVGLGGVALVPGGPEALWTPQKADHDDNKGDQVEENDDAHGQSESVVEGVQVHPATEGEEWTIIREKLRSDRIVVEGGGNRERAGRG